ncbi:hypothetical protein JTE90_025234 [Oedothorax gibbosus]|uniref:C2H2-type domain-containing protein n=1 Tax=Oedothorax gibbosus TaxID=931172 RepID=A0AAV6TZV5_9ARAC|nr:hypothetical protein JTE90_025234 [Oedothorax gibbosus]
MERSFESSFFKRERTKGRKKMMFGSKYFENVEREGKLDAKNRGFLKYTMTLILRSQLINKGAMDHQVEKDNREKPAPDKGKHHICEACKQTFSLKSNLKVHMLTHIELYPSTLCVLEIHQSPFPQGTWAHYARPMLFKSKLYGFGNENT